MAANPGVADSIQTKMVSRPQACPMLRADRLAIAAFLVPRGPEPMQFQWKKDLQVSELSVPQPSGLSHDCHT